MSEPVIRRAAPGEAETVGALWLRLLEEQSALDPRFAPAPDALARWRADFSDRARSGDRRILIAEADGVQVGFATAVRWWPAPIYAGEGEVYVDELYVTPDRRGRGVGTALVDALAGWGLEVGAARLRVGVLAANGESRTFWKARGASPFSETWTLDLDARAPSETSVKDRRIGF